MAAICSPSLYAHAFHEHAPHLVGAVPSWSASWGAPEPEPEPRERDTEVVDSMTTEEEEDFLMMGEMEGMLEFLPELDLGEGACEAQHLMQPWVPPQPQSAPSLQEMDSPGVFRCDSPDPEVPSEAKASAAYLQMQQPQPQQQRKRVSFGAVNRVRTIPAVAHGAEIAFAFGVTPADTDAWLKDTDGPSHTSAMMDLLLRAYFERGATTTEYMQHVLGAESCAAITACAAELAGLCTHLADQLEAAPEGGVVGVLPSNSRLGAPHAPGLRTLAQWMWSC
jgi:hypothetical protein